MGSPGEGPFDLNRAKERNGAQYFLFKSPILAPVAASVALMYRNVQLSGGRKIPRLDVRCCRPSPSSPAGSGPSRRSGSAAATFLCKNFDPLLIKLIDARNKGSNVIRFCC